jgi:hypothetical protein
VRTTLTAAEDALTSRATTALPSKVCSQKAEALIRELAGQSPHSTPGTTARLATCCGGQTPGTTARLATCCGGQIARGAPCDPRRRFAASLLGASNDEWAAGPDLISSGAGRAMLAARVAAN